jgi:hypothetical protein
MKRTKEKETGVVGKVVAVTILCPNLNTNVVVTDYSISASESECDLCGSHGEINLSVMKCECGKMHEIEISSW